jgi:hypothetical protein
LATAYNNNHKILSSPSGDKVHFLFANEGWIIPGGIHYCYSSDSGKTFSWPQFIDSAGVYPGLALDPQENPCASWVSGSNIYYSYWSTSWAPPDTIVLPVENVSPPAIAVDNTDTVHLIFTHYFVLPSNTGELLYLKFQRENFDEAICDTVLTYPNFCRTPSLVLDELGNLHLLWQGENCICYLEEDLNTWLPIDTIYKTTTNEKLYPVIDVFGEKINVVWQERDPSGYLDIYSRARNGGNWDEIRKVCTTSGDSKYPSLTSAHNCLWQDSTSGMWEIYWSEYIDINGAWSDPANISKSSTVSSYPHCTYASVNENAKLYCLWTEGDTIPYIINFEKLDVAPVPVRYTDLGQEIQSSYCQERDGYWKFGDKPYETVDYGKDSLVYRFTNLDSAKEYRLDISYYFKPNPRKGADSEILSQVQNDKKGVIHNERNDGEGIETLNLIQGMVQGDIVEDRGIGRLIQALVIDEVELDSAFIVPHRLVRKSVWIPNELYIDREITVEIEKIKGKVVVCGEISLYEFEGEEDESCLSDLLDGGPQAEKTMHPGSIFLEGISPNPARGDLKIKFNVFNQHNIRVKLYDVTGRLIKEIFDDRLKFGKNEISVSTKNLAAGIYFVRIETEPDIITEKIIMLK